MAISYIYGDWRRGAPKIGTLVGDARYGVKANWNDPYFTPISGLYPRRAEIGLGSQGSYLELEYYYGRVKPPRSILWEYREPLALLGYFTQCDQQAFYIVDDEDHDGHQIFRAVGLEYFLETKILWSETATGPVDRPLAFNSWGQWGQDLAANKEPGQLAFGRGESWTRLDMVRYVLTHFTKTCPMQFRLWGETDPDSPTFDARASAGVWMLEQFTGQFDVWGLTVRDALNVLISRDIGLAWKIRFDGAYAWIDVVSLFDEDVLYGDELGRVRANEDQQIAELDGYVNVKPTVRFSVLDKYSKVVVVGGPVYVCKTFAVGGGGLEPDWTTDQETAYTGAADDEARRSEALRGVYTRFRLPSGLQLVYPNVLADGTLDPTTPGQWHYWGHVFERELPVQLTRREYVAGLPAEEFRGPFAIVTNTAGKWQFVDRLVLKEGQEDEQVYGFNITLHDKDMGFQLTSPVVSHVLKPGKTTNSDVEGVANWETLRFTGMYQSDMRLRAEFTIGNSPHWRVLSISLPEAVAQYVEPGTVVDVEAGALVTDDEGGEYRNDRERLISIGRHAAAWYGRERATMRLEVPDILSWRVHPIGSLIVSAGMGGAYVDVGTVVTRRIYDFTNMTTVIETGHGELRFERFG